MCVCRLTAAVIINAFSQLALLQQAQNTDFHIVVYVIWKQKIYLCSNFYIANIICECTIWSCIWYPPLPNMPVLNMMVFTVCLKGNWFLPSYFFSLLPPAHPPPPPPLSEWSRLFFNSTQLLLRTLHCYEGREEQVGNRMDLHRTVENRVESGTRQPDNRPLGYKLH